jgi:glycosyltransferase involved in cell wall biosynthesis
LTRARKRLVIRAVHVSIVIPLYNEEDNVDPLVRELAAIQPALGQAEVLLVDDGSRDGTWARIAAASRASIPSFAVSAARRTADNPPPCWPACAGPAAR